MITIDSIIQVTNKSKTLPPTTLIPVLNMSCDKCKTTWSHQPKNGETLKCPKCTNESTIKKLLEHFVTRIEAIWRSVK